MTLVYTVNGIAKDQETVVRQRKQYEEYAESLGIEFSSTKLMWQMCEDGTFEFELRFYGYSTGD